MTRQKTAKIAVARQLTSASALSPYDATSASKVLALPTKALSRSCLALLVQLTISASLEDGIPSNSSSSSPWMRAPRPRWKTPRAHTGRRPSKSAGEPKKECRGVWIHGKFGKKSNLKWIYESRVYSWKFRDFYFNEKFREIVGFGWLFELVCDD